MTTSSRRTPLHVACINGHIQVVRALIEANSDIEAKDADLWSPLYWSAERRQEDIVNIFLELGADPNSRTTSGGTALLQVCGWGYLDIAQCLLNAGAEVNIATTWGRTPLHQAASAGALDVVNLLLEHGADPNVSDRSEYTPLDLAEENGHWAVVDVLRPFYLAAEESWDEADEDDEDLTPLEGE